MSIKIEIYTKVYCAYCERAKELLRIKGVNFVEHDITDDRLKAAEMQLRGQWQQVPSIFMLVVKMLIIPPIIYLGSF